jgi:hypothetical protein
MLKNFKIHVSKIFLTDEEENEDIRNMENNADLMDWKLPSNPKDFGDFV